MKHNSNNTVEFKEDIISGIKSGFLSIVDHYYLYPENSYKGLYCNKLKRCRDCVFELSCPCGGTVNKNISEVFKDEFPEYFI